MFALFLIMCLVPGTALLGGAIMMSGNRWYKTIQLPWWAPSGWLLSSLWTLAYAGTLFSTLLAWEAPPSPRLLGIFGLYAGNGLLGILWTEMFFVKRWLLLAFADAAFLWFAVAVLIHFLWKDSRISAAVLLLPFACWIEFIAHLNYAVWKINRDRKMHSSI